MRDNVLVISLNKVLKVYTDAKNEEKVVLNEVNLQIDKGEIFGIVGYSGAGKSTLLRMINGLEPITNGKLMVLNKDIGSLSKRELRNLRQDIGMVFQQFNLLWSRTVAENVSLSLEISKFSKKECKQRVDELLNLVGLAERKDAYPASLSGGQKQRVGIARSLACNPKILLCDEATSALDPETTESILDLLAVINEKLGVTIVLITHEMEVIRKICHRVAVVDQGIIKEVDTVVNVFTHPKEEITKRFVKNVSQYDKDNAVLVKHFENSDDGNLFKLIFPGTSVYDPILTKLIRQFAVEVNILQGELVSTKQGTIGSLLVYINGDKKTIIEAIQFLQAYAIKVEEV